MSTTKIMSVSNAVISNSVYNVEIPLTTITKNETTNYETFYIIFLSEKHCNCFSENVNEKNCKISIADDNIKRTYMDISAKMATPIMAIFNGKLIATQDITDDSLPYAETIW